jgi:hypothetical protein
MGAAPGHVRAYDVRTGSLKWIFHTIPQRGEYGYNTWPTQPIPIKPPAFSRYRMEEADITKLLEESNAYVNMIWNNSLEGYPFIPACGV